MIAWMQLLRLAGAPAQWEPKRLRHRLLHVAARLVRGGRRRWLRLKHRWPWGELLLAVFVRLRALPRSDRPSSSMSPAVSSTTPISAPHEPSQTPQPGAKRRRAGPPFLAIPVAAATGTQTLAAGTAPPLLNDRC